jgi:hypothetical protein
MIILMVTLAFPASEGDGIAVLVCVAVGVAATQRSSATGSRRVVRRLVVAVLFRAHGLISEIEAALIRSRI